MIGRVRNAAKDPTRFACVVAGSLVMGLLSQVPQGAAEQPRGKAPAMTTQSDESLPFTPGPPLQSYVAVRRLESRNERHHKEAWLVARTTLSENGAFHYQILEEGGSELLRNRVLRPTLQREADVVRSGRAGRSRVTHENYEFLPPSRQGGLVRVGIVPRRRDDMLMKGTLVISPDGELLRMEGELVKRPSFWTRSVHVVREFARVAGVRVPVRLESTAQVRFAGAATFSMAYDYQEINGRRVAAMSRGQSAPVTRPRSARGSARPR